MAENFTYQRHSYNGATLRIMKTHAKNIKLINNAADGGSNKTIQQTGDGINGAFFVRVPQERGEYVNMLLNVAYYHGKCLFTKDANYGDAYINNVGKGVIGWDGSSIEYNEDINNASYLDYVVKSSSWAQGGIAMWLGSSNWESKFTEQNAGNYIGNYTAKRSAMICELDGSKNIYLIATDTKVTVSKFRDAIQDYLNISDSNTPSNDFQGIMLDGGGSTQMHAGDHIDILGDAVPEHILVI